MASPQHSGRRKKPDKSTKGKAGVRPYSSMLPGPWQLNTPVVFLCILATAVLYAGDLRLGFFRIDDPQYVVSNTWIQGVTWEHINQILSRPYYLNYSPLHLFSYMLDHAIASLNAYAFHLSSNLWAGVVAGLVYLVALALTQHRLISIAAATLFVVHPVHVEAVAWISSRKDLVAAAFVLPGFLAYLKYRQRGLIAWYLASLLLFLLALLGKLSVVAFPAVLLSLDLFVEKRPLHRSIVDKLPFVLLAALVAVAVQQAQPGTGARPDMSMRAASFFQGIWLLTGLGNYVLYRVPPANGTALAQLAGAIFLLALFMFPLLLRKRYPLVTVLIYWVLFTYLPTQMIAFSYPVTDRYLFLPSVGAVILIAWLVFKTTDRLPRRNVAAATVLITVVSLIWLRKTVDYLSEWQDPRSVWYAATRKTNDFHVYYELGWEYLDGSSKLGTTVRNSPLPAEQSKQLASLVWRDDARLPQLLSELSAGQHAGPTENAFKEYLQTKASENFDRALAAKGEHLMPDLFLSRGVLLLDKGDMQSGKKEFLAELDEVSQLPSPEARQEALVACYYNLAVAEEGLGNSREALSWIRLAEQEQDQLGRTVIPGLSDDRQKIESTMTTHDRE
jgi:4-amino-4-deoxy-L-arabinose transferase and related glycosyltransferases of PMT family